MLYPTAFNGRVFRHSAFYCNIFSIDNQLNELLCDAEVSNELCNLLAPKAKLRYTECLRAFNRSDPNTMTCSNVSVKQYIGISDILLKFQTRATISRRGRRTGLEERGERDGMRSCRGSQPCEYEYYRLLTWWQRWRRYIYLFRRDLLENPSFCRIKSEDLISKWKRNVVANLYKSAECSFRLIHSFWFILLNL